MKLISRFVKPGDKVEHFDDLCEAETDKVTVTPFFHFPLVLMTGCFSALQSCC
jgi:hypothetical protein